MSNIVLDAKRSNRVRGQIYAAARGHRQEWNMGEIGGLIWRATVESQVVLLYSSDKFNFCFMDWVGLKIQTRCHVQLALRQWGGILCLNQETYLLFLESPLLSISVRIWVEVSSAADGFLLPIHPIRIKKCQNSHLLCYMLSIAPMGFPFIPISVSSLAISYFLCLRRSDGLCCHFLSALLRTSHQFEWRGSCTMPPPHTFFLRYSN